MLSNHFDFLYGSATRWAVLYLSQIFAFKNPKSNMYLSTLYISISSTDVLQNTKPYTKSATEHIKVI